MVAFAPTSTTQGIWQLEQIYIGYYGRAVDASGYNYWQAEYNARIGGTYKIGGVTQARQSSADAIASIASSFGAATQAETVALYPFLGSSVTFPTSDTIVKTQIASFVTSVYQNLFNRAPDLTGLTYWTDQIAAGRVSTSVAILAIGNAAGDDNSTQSLADAKVLNNKIAVSDNFLVSTSTNGIGVSGTVPASVLAQAKAILVGVDGTAASVSTAATAQTNWVATGAGTPGTIFNLTTGVDAGAAFTGGTNADTFNATHLTLNASDSLVGGAGSDVLNIVDSGAVGFALPSASVSGIENINLRNVNTGTPVTAVTAVAQVNTITVTGVVAVGDTTQFTFNGVQLNTAGAASGDVTGAANAIVAAINSYAAGSVVASNAAGVITVTAGTAGTGFSLGGFTAKVGAGTVGAEQYATALTTANVTKVSGVTATDTMDASLFVGATDLNSDRSTGAVTITGLASGQNVGVIGDGGTTNGAVTATYNTKVTAATLNVTNGTKAGAVTINGNADNLLTTLTINSNGASNTLGGIATPSAVTTVNIAGSSSLKTGGITGVAASTTINVTNTGIVDLGSLAANVSTVTQTGAGGLTATIGAVAQKVTGGSGVNTITTNGVQTGAVVAGAGTTDKLIVANAADVAATPAAKFTGFEILQNNVAATIDASLVTGITSAVINNVGASGFTNLSATQAAAVSAIVSTAGSTLALKDATGTADVVTLKASSTTAGVDVTNLKIAGVETLNFNNSSIAADTLSFDGTTTTGTGLKAITVAGAKGVTLDLAAQNTPNHDTTIISIDASGLTAQATGTNTFTLLDTVGGAAMKSGTITGSGGDDVFSLGGTTGTNTFANGIVVAISGGAGNDNLTASLAQLYTAGAGWISFDGGANGSSTGDTLTISNTTAGTINDNVFANITNVENLALKDTGAMSLTAGAGFKAAFANGVTVTNGATTSNDVTFDFTLMSAAVKVTNTGTTGVQTITGGSGADTITVTSAAAGNASKVAISGGGGNDTIKWTDPSTITAAIGSVNGGAGKDAITLVLTNNASASSFATITETAGDSTVGNADTITGFYLGAAATRLADTIDFSGAAIKPATAVASTAVTGETLAALAFSVTTAGLLAFTGTKAAAVTAAQVESIWTSQISTLLNNLETVVWADANAADAQNGNSLIFNKNILGDSEVILVGVQATAVGAAAVTSLIVGIA